MLCEIGGTIGDIEGLPFFEAIRQFSQEKKNQFLHFRTLNVATFSIVFRRTKNQTNPTLCQGIKVYWNKSRYLSLSIGSANS